jgi:hypothetical protein
MVESPQDVNLANQNQIVDRPRAGYDKSSGAPLIGWTLKRFRLRTPRDVAGDLDVMCQVLFRVGQECTVLLQEGIDFHAGLETK